MQIQETPGVGTTTKENGTYELTLEVGRYNLVVSMIGYKKQVVNIVVTNNLEQNLILEEEDNNAMEDVVIRVKVKDRAEEIMRKYHAKPSQLPYIMTSDKAIEDLDVRPGDVIKITRKSPTAGESVYYRYVVEG